MCTYLSVPSCAISCHFVPRRVPGRTDAGRFGNLGKTIVKLGALTEEGLPAKKGREAAGKPDRKTDVKK